MKHNLRVERDRLCAPLRDIKNLGPDLLARLEPFRLSMQNGTLGLANSVFSIFIPATGEWGKTLSVRAADLLDAVDCMAQISTISIETSGNQLLIGGAAVDYEIAE